MSNNLVIGIGALVVGGVVGYFAGAGNEKIVEVEKVVEVEKQQNLLSSLWGYVLGGKAIFATADRWL